MFDSIIQQFTGGGGNVTDNALHSGLDTLLGQAAPNHASGAVNETLQSLGPSGFAQSVQDSAQNQGPQERGQIGSVLLNAIEHGGGNTSGVLSQLGIGSQNPQDMSHNELGSLAGYVAANHGGALASVLGTGAAGSGGGSLESSALH
ncbi:MAG: hypothetical protein JWO42_2110, partial [Chloroflexi bacterium]|nr:hypothetical protein [Chloroflexota bacterium]